MLPIAAQAGPKLPKTNSLFLEQRAAGNYHLLANSLSDSQSMLLGHERIFLFHDATDLLFESVTPYENGVIVSTLNLTSAFRFGEHMPALLDMRREAIVKTEFTTTMGVKKSLSIQPNVIIMSEHGLRRFLVEEASDELGNAFRAEIYPIEFGAWPDSDGFALEMSKAGKVSKINMTKAASEKLFGEGRAILRIEAPEDLSEIHQLTVVTAESNTKGLGDADITFRKFQVDVRTDNIDIVLPTEALDSRLLTDSEKMEYIIATKMVFPVKTDVIRVDNSHSAIDDSIAPKSPQD